MDGGQTGPLAGVIEASQLVIPQCKVPVTPFHIGAGTRAYLGESACDGLERVLLTRTQRAQGPTGRKQWGAEALGKRAKQRSCGHCLGRGQIHNCETPSHHRTRQCMPPRK